MSTDFQSTRTKHGFKGKRRRGPSSSRHDEPRILRAAIKEAIYRVAMSPQDGAKGRDEIFMGWISQQFVDLKARGVTRTEAAAKGQVSRNQTYEWEGRGQKGFSRPKPETIKTFCMKNGLDWRIAFRILDYDTSGRSHEELAPPPEPDLDRMIRLIEVRLGQDPPIKERRDLELKLVRARRARDAQRLADELMAEVDDELRREA